MIALPVAPRRSAASVLAAAAILILAGCHREHRHPNVLFVTLDTFRADRLGPHTPNLARLAGEGAQFTNADSPVPLTLPAHCSLLSGTLPLHHGVRNNGANPFPADRETLATAFTRAGYRTGAFVSSFVLDRRFGLARGFERYDDEIPRDPSNEANNLEAERRGDVTVDRALEWLTQGDTRPFFAWVHLYDAHAPYAPPPPYPQTYDGEIAFVDAQFGRLLAAIDRANTVIIVVGDHGEALGEHGELTHGLLLYEPTLHVPMIVAAPAASPHRVTTPVSTIDLAPTALALAGIDGGLPRSDGRDLARSVERASEPEARDLYAESEYARQFGWKALRALRRGPLKLIAAPSAQLFDLARDPGETRNALQDDRRGYRDLQSRLDAVAATAAPAAASAAIDEETKAKLASLGYVAPSAGGSSGANAADPNAMVPLFRRFEEAVWKLNGNQPKEADAILTQLVKDDPSNPVFRDSLARALRQQGNVAAAVPLYREAVAMAPQSADGWYNLAVALEEAGKSGEAAIAVREALRRDARRPEAHNALGIALMNEGKPGEAEREFRAAIDLDSRNARAWNNLGNTLRAMNRLDDARQAYSQAIAIAPRYADPLNGTGVIDVQQDHPRDAVTKFDAALAIAPDFYEAQLNRGIALRTAGDRAAADAQFRHLLASLPNGRAYDEQRRAAQTLMGH